MTGATWNCCHLGAHSAYTIQPCTTSRHFMQKHIRVVRACLAVTCHLQFWQNHQDLLQATVVQWANTEMSQHRKLTLEKKILPPLLPRLKPVTFRSRVWHSNHWTIHGPPEQVHSCLSSWWVHWPVAVRTLDCRQIWETTAGCAKANSFWISHCGQQHHEYVYVFLTQYLRAQQDKKTKTNSCWPAKMLKTQPLHPPPVVLQPSLLNFPFLSGRFWPS